jgi:hypothetical protein
MMDFEYQELTNIILWQKKARNDIIYQNLYTSIYVTC